MMKIIASVYCFLLAIGITFGNEGLVLQNRGKNSHDCTNNNSVILMIPVNLENPKALQCVLKFIQCINNICDEEITTTTATTTTQTTTIAPTTTTEATTTTQSTTTTEATTTTQSTTTTEPTTTTSLPTTTTSLPTTTTTSLPTTTTSKPKPCPTDCPCCEICNHNSSDPCDIVQEEIKKIVPIANSGKAFKTLQNYQQFPYYLNMYDTNSFKQPHGSGQLFHQILNPLIIRRSPSLESELELLVPKLTVCEKDPNGVACKDIKIKINKLQKQLKAHNKNRTIKVMNEMPTLNPGKKVESSNSMNNVVNFMKKYMTNPSQSNTSKDSNQFLPTNFRRRRSVNDVSSNNR